MKLTNDFKVKVRLAILEKRENYGGSDADFSKSLGINNAVFSRLKSGETEKILSDISISRNRSINEAIKFYNKIQKIIIRCNR